MDLSFFMNLLASQDFLVRIGLIIGISFYGLFALIVAIQINNLNRALNQVGFSFIFNVIAVVHMLATIALLILAVLSL
ncbi:MAG TPA: DUF5657 family protein [Patescibacteria group bacterium]|nr:DUF5657 family protein [Patescibacteria group bacterium]